MAIDLPSLNVDNASIDDGALERVRQLFVDFDPETARDDPPTTAARRKALLVDRNTVACNRLAQHVKEIQQKERLASTQASELDAEDKEMRPVTSGGMESDEEEEKFIQSMGLPRTFIFFYSHLCCFIADTVLPPMQKKSTDVSARAKSSGPAPAADSAAKPSMEEKKRKTLTSKRERRRAGTFGLRTKPQPRQPRRHKCNVNPEVRPERNNAKGPTCLRRREKKMISSYIEEDLKKRCCCDDCLSVLRTPTGLAQVDLVRNLLWRQETTPYTRRRVVCRWMRQTGVDAQPKSADSTAPAKPSVTPWTIPAKFVFDKHLYCRTAWETIIGFRSKDGTRTHRTLQLWYKQVRETQDPVRPYLRCVYHAVGRVPVREDAMKWLEAYAELAGEKLTNEAVIRLPEYKYITVWEAYKRDMANRGVKDTLSYSSFVKSWHLDAAGIVPRTHAKSTFAECAICSAYREKMRQQLSLADRNKLRLAQLRHLDDQKAERWCYKLRREEAELAWLMLDPHCLSIIIDALDGWKTKLPHLGDRHPKDLKDGDFLRQKVIGVRVHGWKNFTYIVYPELKGDSDLYLTILLYVLSFCSLLTMRNLPISCF